MGAIRSEAKWKPIYPLTWWRNVVIQLTMKSIRFVLTMEVLISKSKTKMINAEFLFLSIETK